MPKPGFLIVAALLLGWGGQSVAAGKCERLVATGDPQHPPYLWRDPQNPQRLIGANADLLERLGKELGVVIEVLYVGAWSKAQAEARSGRVDLLAGARLTLPRLEVMDYVHPAFFVTSDVVWVQEGKAFPFAGWGDLKGHPGDALADHRFGQAFDAYAREHLSLERVASLTQAFQKLLLGRTDYVIHELYPGLALAQILGMQDNLRVLEPPISSEGLYLTLSHNSACNEAWLRGQLAKKMTELAAAGVPQTLLQRNVQRWKEQQLQALGTQSP